MQSSYGLLKTTSKKESLIFDETTGQITCNVDGVFEVDTSGLKHQMEALKIKYNNIYQEEIERKNKLDEKKKALKRYKQLSNKITKNHTFSYKDNYNCGDKMGLSECKKELKKEISIFFKNKLAKQYNINSSMITISEITYLSDIKIKIDNGIIKAYYDDDIEARAILVNNPYLDIDDESINENIKNDNKRNNDIKSHKFYRNNIHISSDFSKFSESYLIKYRLMSRGKLSFGFSLGKGNYGELKRFPYNFISLGLSYYIRKNQQFNFFLDIDRVFPFTKKNPYAESVYAKSFSEISLMLEKEFFNLILIDAGLKSSGKDDYATAIVVFSIGTKY